MQILSPSEGPIENYNSKSRDRSGEVKDKDSTDGPRNQTNNKVVVIKEEKAVVASRYMQGLVGTANGNSSNKVSLQYLVSPDS